MVVAPAVTEERGQRRISVMATIVEILFVQTPLHEERVYDKIDDVHHQHHTCQHDHNSYGCGHSERVHNSPYPLLEYRSDRRGYRRYRIYESIADLAEPVEQFIDDFCGERGFIVGGFDVDRKS